MDEIMNSLTIKQWMWLSIGVVVFLWLFFSIVSEVVRSWRHAADIKREIRIKEKLEAKKKKKEDAKEAKIKQKIKHVGLDNYFLNLLTKNRTIIFKGFLGAGKTMAMNLVSHWLYSKILYNDRKNKRFNEIMNPGRLEVVAELNKKNVLPVYSNNPFKDRDSGKVSQDVMPILYQDIKSCEGSIKCLDEMAKNLPKSLYQENLKNPDPKLKELKDYGEHHRQYDNGWLLGTDQSGQDIWIGLRNSGYALVDVKNTDVTIAKKGKKIIRKANIKNTLGLGWFTGRPFEYIDSQLFLIDKIKAAFKLLLPTYYSNAVRYYKNRIETYEKVKAQYQRYEIDLVYQGRNYTLEFGNESIFVYDTRAYQVDYDTKFDKNGIRKNEKLDSKEPWRTAA